LVIKKPFLSGFIGSEKLPLWQAAIFSLCCISVVNRKNHKKNNIISILLTRSRSDTISAHRKKKKRFITVYSDSTLRVATFTIIEQELSGALGWFPPFLFFLQRNVHVFFLIFIAR